MSTPGPWIVIENKRERTIQIDTADGRGTVVQPGAISWLPDAKLIAKAPEMRWLIERLVTTLGHATKMCPAEVMEAQGYTALMNEGCSLLAKI